MVVLVDSWEIDSDSDSEELDVESSTNIEHEPYNMVINNSNNSNNSRL
jgi:hypothetical protein